MLRLLYVLALLTQCLYADARAVCKGEAGEEVDWFYMYKLPQHYNTTPHFSSSGYDYLYVSSSQPNGWQFSKTQVNASDSMPALTLQPLFDDENVLVLAYNDEFPNGTTPSNGGHTKGVVATDGVTGLWLVHSVPKYPTVPAYSYPSSGAHYGQSFLCLSLDSKQMQQVGEQLTYNEPHIYHAYVPAALSGVFPALERAVSGQWIKAAPYNHVAELVTLGGVSFQSFAKSSKYGKDLYEDWLAPTLNTNLLVETWRNGAGNMASNCSQQEVVYNIRNIASKDLLIDFHTTNDHSKWAVAEAAELVSTLVSWWRRLTFAPTPESNDDWVCVGDINRQEHQEMRGGGTVCQRNAVIAELYRNLITDYEPCTKP